MSKSKYDHIIPIYKKTYNIYLDHLVHHSPQIFKRISLFLLSHSFLFCQTRSTTAGVWRSVLISEWEDSIRTFIRDLRPSSTERLVCTPFNLILSQVFDPGFLFWIPLYLQLIGVIHSNLFAHLCFANQNITLSGSTKLGAPLLESEDPSSAQSEKTASGPSSGTFRHMQWRG